MTIDRRSLDGLIIADATGHLYRIFYPRWWEARRWWRYLRTPAREKLSLSLSFGQGAEREEIPVRCTLEKRVKIPLHVKEDSRVSHV